MKKMLTALLLTVLFLFAGTHCFALDTARQTRGQVCADGNITYPIVYGDTLSGIAWKYGTTVDVLQHMNGIVDPDMIYAEDTLCIPTAGRRIAPVSRKKNAVGVPTKQVAYNVTINNDDVVTPLATPAPTNDLTLPADVIATTQPFTFTFTPSETSAATLVAAAPTKQLEQSPVPPNLEKAKRTTKGYQILFTSAEAKERGIVLNQNLLTEVILFNSEQDKKAWKEDGEIHDLRSRAEMKGKDVILSVSLKKLPEHFDIIIVGLNRPIDGDYFTANCQPILGRFPGPHAFPHALSVGGKILANGLLMTGTTFNPILGLTVGIGSPVAYLLLQGHANHLEQNALIEYERLNAECDAEEFLILHPQGELP